MESSHCSILEDPHLRSFGLFSLQKILSPLIFRKADSQLDSSEFARSARAVRRTRGSLRGKRETDRQTERKRERERERERIGLKGGQRGAESPRTCTCASRRGLMSVVET